MKSWFACFVALIPLVYILFWGFRSDCGDMTELIPAVKKMIDPSLYPRDFYLNFTGSLFWHERSFMLLFLKYTLSYSFIPMVLCFYLISVLFVRGVANICFEAGLGKSGTVVLILLLLFIAPYFSVGANELYYPMLNGSSIAKCIAIWGIWYFLKGRTVASFSLLGLAVWFQVLVGLQLGLILGLILLWREFRNPSRWIPASGLFVLLGITCVLLILGSRLSVHAHTDLFQNLVEFRIGHHFYIRYSSILSILVYPGLVIWGFYSWRSRNVIVYQFFIVQSVFLLLYLFDQFTINSAPVLQTQWLKTTIWIEFFSLISIIGYLQENLNYLLNRRIVLLLMFLIGCGAVYKFEKRTHSGNDESVLAEWARKNTDPNSLFVIPPEFSCFKSRSERSLWVDFKSVNHQLAYFAPWYDRINRIYRIGLQDRRAGLDLMKIANENYRSVNPELLIDLNRMDGVDYFVLPVEWKIPDLRFEEMYATGNYHIVRCRPE